MIRRSGNGHFLIEDRLECADLLDTQFSLMLAPDIESIPRKDGWFLDRDGRPLGSIRFFGEFVHTSVRGDPETGQGWFSDIFMSKAPTTQLLISGKLGHSRVLKVEVCAEASSAAT
jgi:hypothetical protein